MTEQQQDQWNKYACGARCLIELARQHKKEISPDNFILRFKERFAGWTTHLGLSPTSVLIDIARRLNLCDDAKSVRYTKAIADCFEKRAHNGTNGILVFTDLAPDLNNPLVMVPEYHCRLLLDIQQDDWTLWHPDRSGKEFPVNVKEATLQAELCHFLILY